MEYYKIVAFHSSHGFCRIIPYDQNGNVSRNFGEFDSEQEAIEANKNASKYSSTDLPHSFNRENIKNLSAYGFQDVGVMKFFKL